MSELPIPGASPRKRRGCFFYGCLTVLLLALLAGVAGFLAVRYAVQRYHAFLENYTAAKPAPLPPVTLSPADYAELEQRVTTFREALEARAATPPLALTAEELNALIARSPAFRDWRDTLRVSLAGEQVKAQVSLPLTALSRLPGLAGLRDRYVNGIAVLKPSLTNGVLVVTLESLEVNGRTLPREILSRLRQQNLAQDAYRDVRTAETLRRFESLEINDGRLVLQARRQGP